MITFKSLASSSMGNAYLIDSPGTAPLLLEAGLPIRKLREKLRDNGVMLTDLAGCLISHEHGDHAKAVKDLLKAGVDCYMSGGTAMAIGVITHHRFNAVLKDEIFDIGKNGEYLVTSFNLEHDSAQPMGFFISHGNDRLLFIPDTAYVKNRFESPTIIAVECNHIEDILSENITTGIINPSVGRRIRRTHMSLENLIEMLKSNDLSKCRQIFLLHLSDSNSNADRMKREVQSATGIPVTICE